MICTARALAIANSPWSHAWESFWHTEASFAFGSSEPRNSLRHWIDDGLMTIFFFLVGLEIKRESINGELRTLTKAALRIIAAIGGMLVPAGVYLIIQGVRDGHRG